LVGIHSEEGVVSGNGSLLFAGQFMFVALCHGSFDPFLGIKHVLIAVQRQKIVGSNSYDSGIIRFGF